MRKQDGKSREEQDMSLLCRVARSREGLTVRFDCLSGAVLPVKIRPPTKVSTTALIEICGSCMPAIAWPSNLNKTADLVRTFSINVGAHVSASKLVFKFKEPLPGIPMECYRSPDTCQQEETVCEYTIISSV
jgi:hypothetical protein